MIDDELSLYRVACRIVGTSLVLLGGSALFEDLNNSSYGKLKKVTGPDEAPLPVSAYQIFGDALCVLTGISVWLALKSNSRSILQGSSCLTMTLGVYPVVYELQILRLERSISEIISAFFSCSVFLHILGAYFLWRYTDVLLYEEEQRELRRVKNLWKKYNGSGSKSSKGCRDSKPKRQDDTEAEDGTTKSSEATRSKRPRLTRSSLNAPTSEDRNLPIPISKFRPSLQINSTTEVPTTLRTSKRKTDSELKTVEEEEDISEESMTEEDANELRQLIEALRLKQGRKSNSTTDERTNYRHSKHRPREPTSRSALESTEIKEQTDELSSGNMKSISRHSGKSKVSKKLRTSKDYNPSKWCF